MRESFTAFSFYRETPFNNERNLSLYSFPGRKYLLSVDFLPLIWYNTLESTYWEAAMNLLHMKYAVEIAEAGSINKAAERLYVGQPNLSRAVKELETSLGVAIFDRSSKGMFLTPDGEMFIRSAKNILKQVDAVEQMFQKDAVRKKTFFHFRAPCKLCGRCFCQVFETFG